MTEITPDQIETEARRLAKERYEKDNLVGITESALSRDSYVSKRWWDFRVEAENNLKKSLMANNEFKIEVGKTYITEKNQIVVIKSKTRSSLYTCDVFLGSNDCHYNEKGYSLITHGIQRDISDFLVSEISLSGITDLIITSENVPKITIQKSASAMFEEYRLWGEKTFGPVSPSRIVARAKEEFDKELVPAVAGDVWTDKALEEAADVIVILTRAPGLWEAIERKMQINYNRQWNVKGDGTGYHIPSNSD